MSHTYVITADEGVPVFIYWGSGNMSKIRLYFLKNYSKVPMTLWSPWQTTWALRQQRRGRMTFCSSEDRRWVVLIWIFVNHTMFRGTRTSRLCRGLRGSSCLCWRTTRPGSEAESCLERDKQYKCVRLNFMLRDTFSLFSVVLNLT